MEKYDFRVAIVDGGSTTVTINSGQSTSSVLDVGGTQLRAVILPSNFTSATINFVASKLPPTDPKFSGFYAVLNFDGSLYSASVSPNQWLPVDPAVFDTARYIEIVSSVTQVSTVTIDFGLAPIYQGIHG